MHVWGAGILATWHLWRSVDPFVESVLSFPLRTFWAPECRSAGLLGRCLYLWAILAAPVLYFLFCYCFKKGSHVAQIGWGEPWADPPASTSPVLGLQACTIMSDLCFCLSLCSWFDQAQVGGWVRLVRKWFLYPLSRRHTLFAHPSLLLGAICCLKPKSIY